MQKCLDLAQKGRANAAPNPMVGCVIVHDGEIIGEGFHEQYGQAHAEVNAVNSVQNKSLLHNASVDLLIVTQRHHLSKNWKSLALEDHQPMHLPYQLFSIVNMLLKAHTKEMSEHTYNCYSMLTN